MFLKLMIWVVWFVLVQVLGQWKNDNLSCIILMVPFINDQCPGTIRAFVFTTAERAFPFWVVQRGYFPCLGDPTTADDVRHHPLEDTGPWLGSHHVQT